MYRVARAGPSIAALATLVALAGCGSGDDGSKTSGEAGTQRPARGFSGGGQTFYDCEDKAQKFCAAGNSVNVVTKDDPPASIADISVRCASHFPGENFHTFDAGASGGVLIEKGKFNANGSWAHGSAKGPGSVSGTRSADGRMLTISWTSENQACMGDLNDLVLKG